MTKRGFLEKSFSGRTLIIKKKKVNSKSFESMEENSPIFIFFFFTPYCTNRNEIYGATRGASARSFHASDRASL